MLRVDFPHGLKSWDRFKAFYVGVRHHGFDHPREYSPHLLYLFETGELVAYSGERRPHQRGDYPVVGVSLLTTHDVQLYTPSGEPVPKAQLNRGGQQNILVDWSTGRAVGVDYRDPDPTKIPTRFVGARAYISEPGAPPVGSPLHISLPFAKHSTPEEREQVDEYVKVARVAMLMTEHEATKPRFVRCPLNPERAFACPDWRNLELWEQIALFRLGVDKFRTVEVDYLLTSPGGAPYKS